MWIHDKFEFTFQLFLNPCRIQIWTQFFCGSQFLPLLSPHISLFSQFSLSLLQMLCCSSLSRPLQFLREHHIRPPWPIVQTYPWKNPIQANKSPKSQHNNTKKNLIHISVMIQKTQQNPAQHHQTFLLVLGSGTATLLGLGYCPSEREEKGKRKKNRERREVKRETVRKRTKGGKKKKKRRKDSSGSNKKKGRKE
jgi:hypothetical protein